MFHVGLAFSFFTVKTHRTATLNPSTSATASLLQPNQHTSWILQPVGRSEFSTAYINVKVYTRQPRLSVYNQWSTTYTCWQISGTGNI